MIKHLFVFFLVLVTPIFAAKGDITDAQARYELAKVLSYQKKYPEALKELQRVLEEKPDFIQAKIELSKVKYKLGRQDEALIQLDHLARDEKSKEYYGDIALVYVDMKQYEKASKLFDEYLQSHPDDLKVLLKYAEMLSWSKQYAKSVVAYQKLLAQRPEDIQVRRKYALVLIWMGNPDEGAEELKKTLKP